MCSPDISKTIYGVLQFVKLEKDVRGLPVGLGIHRVGTREIDTCYGETCKAILSKIKDWATAEIADGQPSVLWLSGGSGSGKSTIVKTIAAWANGEGILGSCFFYIRELRSELSKSSYFISYISHRISNFDTSLTESVTKALVEIGALYEGILIAVHSQNEDSVVDLWHSTHGLDTRRRPVLIVVDALDECDDMTGVPTTINFLSTLTSLNPCVRVIISSRPERHIRSAFDKIAELCPSKFAHWMVEDFVETDDIEKYLRHELSELGHPNQPIMDDLNSLVTKCGRRFIYASIASCFIRDGGTPDGCMERFKTIISIDSGKTSEGKPNKQLDDLYLHLLTQSVGNGRLADSKSMELLRRIFGVMVLSHTSLPFNALAKILEEDREDIEAVVQQLGETTILAREGSHDYKIPYFPHVSLPEFLLDSQRCSDERFFIDAPHLESYLFQRCIDIIIEGLVTTSDKVEKGLQAVIRYASLNWGYHLEKTYHKDTQVAMKLRQFLRHNLLRWLRLASEPGLNTDGLNLVITAARNWVVCIFARRSQDF